MTDRTNRKTTATKIYQYDDWTCLMCQNLNYSFRKTCNRCRVQTKQNNDYLLEVYHASVCLAMTEATSPIEINPQNPENASSAYGEHSFPKCLFLELSGDQEQENSLIRRETPEQETPRWINCLIGE